jgi:cadmium resistance protein CadD (predicted permease)
VEPLGGVLAAATLAFVATNVDGLFLVAALLSDGANRPRLVFAGTFAAIAFLYAASVLASLVSLLIPERFIALLGLAPLAIGIMQLRSDGGPPESKPVAHGVFAVTAINIAAGGDNIGVYTPLFAAATVEAIALTGAVFAVLTGMLCWAAHRLVTHPSLGAQVRRWGPRAVPWVLIGLGVWILFF